MTEQEARRILDEHRSECPRFYRGRALYCFRRDGSVDVYRASAKQAVFEHTVRRDDPDARYLLHPDVFRRFKETR